MIIKNLQELTDLSNLELIAKGVVEGFLTGLHKSPFHGFSSEFNQHRLYNQGESTRFVDWKLFAKTDKLYVKRYEDETNLRCHILIDSSRSMLYKANKKFSKLDFAVVCAAALIKLLNNQRDAVGLSIFDKKIRVQQSEKVNDAHTQMLFSYLEKTLNGEYSISAQNDNLSIANALNDIAESLKKRSMLMIFSDMFDLSKQEEIFDALGHLKYQGHQVILFHIVDKNTEIDFDFENRPTRFIDIESNQEIKLNPADYQEGYQKVAKEFRQNLKYQCGMLKIDFVEADVNDDFKKILVPYLS